MPRWLLLIGLVFVVGCGSGDDDAASDKAPAASDEAPSPKPVTISKEDLFTLHRIDVAERMRKQFDVCVKKDKSDTDAQNCDGYVKAASCMQTAASERELVECEYQGRAAVAFAQCLSRYTEQAGQGVVGDLDECDERQEAIEREGKRKAGRASDEALPGDERRVVERAFDRTVGSRFGGFTYSRCEKLSEGNYACEGRSAGRGGVWDAELTPDGDVLFTPRP